MGEGKGSLSRFEHLARPRCLLSLEDYWDPSQSPVALAAFVLLQAAITELFLNWI